VGAFLNTASGAYPRYSGDIALDPDAPWVIVEETARPALGEGEFCKEGTPIQDEHGIWRQVWQVVTLTLEQIAAREQLQSRRFPKGGA
jgi:hypothetical protein